MCISVLPNYVYTNHIRAWCLQRSEEGVGSPRTGVIDGCEPPCRCQELNSGLLEEQPVLLTTKPSLQSSFFGGRGEFGDIYLFVTVSLM